MANECFVAKFNTETLSAVSIFYIMIPVIDGPPRVGDENHLSYYLFSVVIIEFALKNSGCFFSPSFLESHAMSDKTVVPRRLRSPACLHGHGDRLDAVDCIASAGFRALCRPGLFRPAACPDKRRLRSRFALSVLETKFGGVYVANLEPNPWLKHPKRDVTTNNEDMLTLINPAWMTRQINEMQQGPDNRKIVSRLTSSKLLNPGNEPDDWEKKALGLLEPGGREEVFEFRAAI